MLFAYSTSFSLLEWLALTGLAQGVLILVYICFRVRNWRQAALAISYFAMLVCAFGLQFALRLEDYESTIRLALWFCWGMCPPLCYLLVLQIIRLVDFPPPRNFLVLVSIPLAFAFVAISNMATGEVCDDHSLSCTTFLEWLHWLGAMAGGVSLLALWVVHRGLFSGLWSAKGGRERYWLVLTLVAANIGVVTVNLLRSAHYMRNAEADAMLVVLGLAFIYLATTSLFRIYPPPVQLTAASRIKDEKLTDEEEALAGKVREFMDVQKVYHEQTFSRADMARELNCSESVLSRVINVSFGKSFPKLLNEYRVADAKRLLESADAPIQVIAFEVGFNSLASFNRVFKEVTGDTPSAFRISARHEK